MEKMSNKKWLPPEVINKDDLIKISDQVLEQPDIPIKESNEDIFRIRELEMDWDIATEIVEPVNEKYIPRDLNGKYCGILLIHGGASDHREKIPLARLLATKFGFKVVCFSYPGRFNFLTENHEWPGDTIHDDGSLRTPLWTRELLIDRDQYDVLYDRSDLERRKRSGTVIFAVSKPGTEFFNRMAAWPAAFEEGLKKTCSRNFPIESWSIYVHGHSTGGPFAHLLLQRVSNIAGLVGAETSPFGSIYGKFHLPRNYPFNYLTIRTWRDIAGYMGPETGKEGIWEKGLPWMMEEVLEQWDKAKHFAQFKAEHPIHYGLTEVLEKAAKINAQRLKMSKSETNLLISRFSGYTKELSGLGVKPLPPLLYGIVDRSRDHTLFNYNNILIPELMRINPSPKVHIVQYKAGVHGYLIPEEGLPHGIAPVITKVWYDAIVNGWYKL